MEIPPRTTRSFVWIQTLGSPMLWVANAVLGLLLWGDIIVRTYPDTESYFRNLAFVTDLPSDWKIIITLIVNIVLVVELSFRAVRRREQQRDEYRAKLLQIEQSRPHIVLREGDAETVDPVHIQAIENTTNIVSFIKVWFVNKRNGLPFPNSVAHDVRAKIRFYEPTAGGRLLLAMEGKWTDRNEPSIREWREHRNDLLKMDFAVDEERTLDVAFRDDVTGEFYAFNNDNYNYPQMKKPDHLLTGQHFLVRISLIGPWVDETFQFLFAHDSAGTKILRPLDLSGDLRVHA